MLETEITPHALALLRICNTMSQWFKEDPKDPRLHLYFEHDAIRGNDDGTLSFHRERMVFCLFRDKTPEIEDLVYQLKVVP